MGGGLSCATARVAALKWRTQRRQVANTEAVKLERQAREGFGGGTDLVIDPVIDPVIDNGRIITIQIVAVKHTAEAKVLA